MGLKTARHLTKPQMYVEPNNNIQRAFKRNNI